MWVTHHSLLSAQVRGRNAEFSASLRGSRSLWPLSCCDASHLFPHARPRLLITSTRAQLLFLAPQKHTPGNRTLAKRASCQKSCHFQQGQNTVFSLTSFLRNSKLLHLTLPKSFQRDRIRKLKNFCSKPVNVISN